MSHGAKFRQNPRFGVANHFHDLENVSVKVSLMDLNEFSWEIKIPK